MTFQRKLVSSRNMLTPLFVVFFCYFISLAGSQQQYNQNLKNVLSDMPSSTEDMPKYIKSLELILQYFKTHKNEITLEFCFGLFLANVQLRHIPKSSDAQISKIWEMIETGDNIINNFVNSGMSNNRSDVKASAKKMEIVMWKAMNNETEWTNHVENFNFNLLRIDNPSLHGIDKFIYPNWNDYEKIMFRPTADLKPSIKLSDRCLTELVKDNIEKSKDVNLKPCNTAPDCRDMILTGTNFGYWLTHRAMYLIYARFAEQCYVISPEKDRELLKMMCAYMYVESDYTALQDFQILEIILEQMIFCSLDGHAQFLRRSWLNKILEAQYSNGCFYFTKRLKQCNFHTTATVAGTLGAAIRFIAENDAAQAQRG